MIGKELQLGLALLIELVLVLGKEIVLGKDYLVQCPNQLNINISRASTRERLFSSVSPITTKELELVLAPGKKLVLAPRS